MLRRLIYCGECGSLVMPAWTNNHGREYRYYTCSKKVKTGYKKCSMPSLPAGELEKIVVEQLRSLLRHPDVIAHTFREVCASSQSGRMRRRYPVLKNYVDVATRQNRRPGLS